MTDASDLRRKSEKIRHQLETKLGVRSKSLAQALKRTGRRLPRRLRKQGAVLVRAEGLAQNPKLARMVDAGEVTRAYDAIDNHLRGYDAADMRKGRILSLVASIVFNLLVVVILLIAFLWWRGYV